VEPTSHRKGFARFWDRLCLFVAECHQLLANRLNYNVEPAIPQHFGGGFYLYRHRRDDASIMPKG
jgi:hypothetical protein